MPNTHFPKPKSILMPNLLGLFSQVKHFNNLITSVHIYRAKKYALQHLGINKLNTSFLRHILLQQTSVLRLSESTFLWYKPQN